MPVRIEKSPLEMLERVEKALLGLHCLLVLEHLLTDVIDDAKLVNVDLDLIFVVL